MAKREPDPEPLDELPVEPEIATAGERLRTAREAKKLSLDDVAAQTRIPLRHLASIESGDWEHLPAPTYTIGFAKSYASAVDLDRTEIGNQLREEMGGQRFTSTSSDVFEPADPARTMPKWLVIGAIAAVILLVVLMSWLNSRSLQQTDDPAVNVAAPEVNSVASTPAPPPAPATAQGQVVLTATAPVWLQVSERGGTQLFSGMLQPGQNYTVPATASAPVLKTGKPEALRITVGPTAVRPVGPAATTISNVSLLPADLLKTPAAAPAPSSPPPAAAPAPPRQAARARPAPPPPAPEPVETPPMSNSGE
jgi:cytoskeleton protein RodZ